MGHLDAQRREIKKKLVAAVTASGTSLTEIFGVGPVIAATVIGDVITVARFPSRNHFAAYNGTAPVEVSSGQRKIYRLSLRGNRRLNHAVHMAAITQIRHKHSDGRAYYQRKLAEGKTHKEALRCLKRRISDAIYARLRADARNGGPGGQPGNDTDSSVTGSHPEHRFFGQATPGPEPSLRVPATFTASVHVWNILGKLHAASRGGAAVKAHALCLLDLYAGWVAAFMVATWGVTRPGRWWAVTASWRGSRVCWMTSWLGAGAWCCARVRRG